MGTLTFLYDRLSVCNQPEASEVSRFLVIGEQVIGLDRSLMGQGRDGPRSSSPWEISIVVHECVANFALKDLTYACEKVSHLTVTMKKDEILLKWNALI